MPRSAGTATSAGSSAISVEFLAAQAIAAVVAPHLRPTASQRTMIAFGRFALAILYVAVVTGAAPDRRASARPRALFIPIVALAAAQGTRQAVLVGAAAISLYLLPVLSATPDNLTIDAQRAIALGGTAILLSIGTRRSISALTVTVRRLGDGARPRPAAIAPGRRRRERRPAPRGDRPGAGDARADRRASCATTSATTSSRSTSARGPGCGSPPSAATTR